MAVFRMGHGFDVHAFEMGKPLRLGGVAIDSEYGLKAHSDGDVVLHAVCDALLGAMGKGDCGEHFSDTDPAFHRIDSRELVKMTLTLLQDAGFIVSNLDITIIAQVPKLMAYKQAMRTTIADLLSVSHNAVNIKATTTEGLGYIGNKEGMAVHAVVLIENKG
jgi:2-C-methyl-D-erythritol 2,4-cyclodiphosphate synthase